MLAIVMMSILMIVMIMIMILSVYESEYEEEYINIVRFNKLKDALANMSSNLSASDIKFMKSIYVIPEYYTCMLPKPTDKNFSSQIALLLINCILWQSDIIIKDELI